MYIQKPLKTAKSRIDRGGPRVPRLPSPNFQGSKLEVFHASTIRSATKGLKPAIAAPESIVLLLVLWMTDVSFQ